MHWVGGGVASGGSSMDTAMGPCLPLLNGEQVHGHKHRISLQHQAKASDWAQVLQESMRAANGHLKSSHGLGADECFLVPATTYHDTVRRLQEVLSGSRAPAHAAELLAMFQLACQFCAAHAPDLLQLPVRTSTQLSVDKQGLTSTPVPEQEQPPAGSNMQASSPTTSDKPIAMRSSPTQGSRLQRAHGLTDSARHLDSGGMLLPSTSSSSAIGKAKQQVAAQAIQEDAGRQSAGGRLSRGNHQGAGHPCRKLSWLPDLLGCRDQQSVDTAAPLPAGRR